MLAHHFLTRWAFAPILLFCTTWLAITPALQGAAPASQPSTQPALPWGNIDEGVQCAIMPGRASFAAGQRVAFLAAVRNVGQRQLFVVRSQTTCQIELDGRWYQYFGNVEATAWPLEPGREYRDIEIRLDADWIPLNHSERFKLTTGRHVFRVAVIAQNEQPFEPIARPISQSVEFEVKQP
jgi:hypothetical protein